MTLTIQQYHDDAKLKEDTSELTEANFPDALRKQAGLFAWYSSQFIEADNQMGKVQHLLKVLEYKLYEDALAHFVSIGETKTPTEARIRAWVGLHPKHLKATQYLADATYTYNKAKMAVEAMKDRRRMIDQFANLKREELRGQSQITASQISSGQRVDRREMFEQKRKQFLESREGNAEADIIIHETD